MIEISLVHQVSPKLLWTCHGSPSLQNCHDDSRLKPKLRHDALQASGYPQTKKKVQKGKEKEKERHRLALSPSQYFNILSLPTVQK